MIIKQQILINIVYVRKCCSVLFQILMMKAVFFVNLIFISIFAQKFVGAAEGEACLADTDCESNEQCFDYKCAFPEKKPLSLGESCTHDWECEPDLSCVGDQRSSKICVASLNTENNVPRWRKQRNITLPLTFIFNINV